MPFATRWAIRCVIARVLPVPAHVEIEKRLIFLEGNDFWNVQMPCREQIQLAGHIEVEESLHLAVRRNDAARHFRVSRRFLELRPLFCSIRLRPPERNRQGYPPRCRIPCRSAQCAVSHLFRRERGKVLSAVFGNCHLELDSLEIHAQSVRGIILERHSDCGDSGGQWIFLTELAFVERGVGPRLGGNR